MSDKKKPKLHVVTGDAAAPAVPPEIEAARQFMLEELGSLMREVSAGKIDGLHIGRLRADGHIDCGAFGTLNPIEHLALGHLMMQAAGEWAATVDDGAEDNL